MSQRKVHLEFGVQAPAIEKQLQGHGFYPTSKQASHWQRIADSVLYLKVHGYLGSSLVEALEMNLIREIFSELSDVQSLGPSNN